LIELIFIIAFTVVFISIIVFFAKGTVISVSYGSNSIWSLIFYKEIVFIFSAVLLLAIYPVDDFYSLIMVDQSRVFEISLWVIYALFTFIILYIVMLRYVFSKDKFKIEKWELLDCLNKKQIVLFSASAIFTAVLLLFLSVLFLNYQHAFLGSIVAGESLLDIRLKNKYTSELPSQIAYVISVGNWIAAIFSAYLLLIKKRVFFIIIFMTGLILATAAGSKAPVIQYIMIFVIAYIFIVKPKISKLQVFFLLPVYAFFLLTVLYFVVSLQIPNLDVETFFIYLIERLGVGQMTGVYETLSIGFQSSEYAWHVVPFASFFVDYPIFSKELMLYTEHYEHDQIGVKNSFFIAEAYGMGGTLIMFISPFVMAFAYILKGLLLYFTLKILFGGVVAKLYFIPVFFLSTNLTGDFSSFVLQKGTILLLLVFCLFYLMKILLNPVYRMRCLKLA
jgi:hypothetical protein